MNYIKPEDIKAYVEQNPQGIAGMSEELATMVNHFTELIVRECADKVHELIKSDGDEFPLQAVSYRIKQHFGVEE